MAVEPPNRYDFERILPIKERRLFLLRLSVAGFYVNCEGGIGSTNPILKGLVKKGFIRLKRSKMTRDAIHDKTKNAGVPLYELNGWIGFRFFTRANITSAGKRFLAKGD